MESSLGAILTILSILVVIGGIIGGYAVLKNTVKTLKEDTIKGIVDNMKEDKNYFDSKLNILNNKDTEQDNRIANLEGCVNYMAKDIDKLEDKVNRK